MKRSEVAGFGRPLTAVLLAGGNANAMDELGEPGPDGSGAGRAAPGPRPGPAVRGYPLDGANRQGVGNRKFPAFARPAEDETIG